MADDREPLEVEGAAVQDGHGLIEFGDDEAKILVEAVQFLAVGDDSLPVFLIETVESRRVRGELRPPALRLQSGPGRQLHRGVPRLSTACGRPQARRRHSGRLPTPIAVTRDPPSPT